MNTNSMNSSDWTIRIIPWFMLLLMAGISAVFFVLCLNGNASLLVAGIYFLLMAFLLFFCEVTVFTFSAATSQITVRRMRIWRTVNDSMRLAELHSIAVERSMSVESSGPSYRVKLVSDNGDTIRLTGYASSGKRNKEKLAKKIHGKLSPYRSRPIDLALDGMVRVEKNGSMRGIDWHIDFIFKNDAVPVTRWQAACHDFPGGFLLVVPAAGSYRGALPGGILGKAVRKLYDGYLQVLDLDIEALPDFESAEILQSSPSGASDAYTFISNNPVAARSWMERRGARLLNDWKQRNALKAGKGAGEAHVLLTSQRIYLALRGCFNSEQHINDIVRLGTSLVES